MFDENLLSNRLNALKIDTYLNINKVVLIYLCSFLWGLAFDWIQLCDNQLDLNKTIDFSHS